MIPAEAKRALESIRYNDDRIEKSFPELDTMFQLLAAAGSGPLQVEAQIKDDWFGTVELAASTTLTSTKRLRLVCSDRPLAALELQTNIDGWKTIVSTVTGKRSHFVDLLSTDCIQETLAVKPYPFGPPIIHDSDVPYWKEERQQDLYWERGAWDDVRDDVELYYDMHLPAAAVDDRTLVLYGIVSIDRETFELTAPTRGEVGALVGVFDWDSSKLIVATDGGWWNVSTTVNWWGRRPGIYSEVINSRSHLAMTHVWGFAGRFWKPHNYELETSKFDPVYIGRLLNMVKAELDRI